VKKIKLVDILKNGLKDIISNHCLPSFSRSAPWTEMRGGQEISLDEEAIRLLSELVQNIFEKRPAFHELFTESHIKDRLIDVIFSCKAVPTSNLDAVLLKEIKKALRKLGRKRETWVFLVPIINLKMIGIKKFSIGEVNFYQLNLKTLKYLESKFKLKIGHDKSPKNRLSQVMDKQTNVLSVVRATAGEIGKAKEIAFFKVESGLNILRLYGPNLNIGIQRGFITELSMENVYYKNMNTKSWGSSLHSPLPLHLSECLIDRTKLGWMKKKGKLKMFNSLLRGACSTDLAPKIAMSIHWYGLAIKDKYEVDRYIKLVVALESLLLGSDDRSKKQTLADRAAFILGKGKDGRKDISELVKKIYSIRSKIVHEGKVKLFESDTLILISLIRHLIFAMLPISTRRNSLTEIDERIDEIKFSSQIRGI